MRKKKKVGTSGRGQVLKMYKEVLKFNSVKTDSLISKMVKALTDTSPKNKIKYI